MAIRIVRLGSPRAPGEGLRIGTVRRPPRGVPKAAFAAQDWYDVWYPNLAPSAETMKLGQSAETPAQWAAFTRLYQREMAEPDASRNLDLLAALSHHGAMAVGCYCEDEARCHRSVLRGLLAERGAAIRMESTSSSWSTPPRADSTPRRSKMLSCAPSRAASLVATHTRNSRTAPMMSAGHLWSSGSVGIPNSPATRSMRSGARAPSWLSLASSRYRAIWLVDLSRAMQLILHGWPADPRAHMSRRAHVTSC